MLQAASLSWPHSIALYHPALHALCNIMRAACRSHDPCCAWHRWVNCLLLREVPFHLGFRLWDTYLAEGRGMKEFLVYVAASFLLHWGPALQNADFQVIWESCSVLAA